MAEDDRLHRELLARVPERAGEVLLDLGRVRFVDGASAATLLSVRARIRMSGSTCEFVAVPPETAELLELYGCPLDHTCLLDPPRSIGTLDHLGRGAMDVVANAKGILAFVGELVSSLVAAVRRPRTVDWGDLGRLMERAGADGTPIVLLINFLVGLIIALQASVQLQRFGATVFVSDLVGLSVVRELAPLMTAILVAGRSGAAFAAELGSMRVSEEIDALKAMRLDPLRQLVFPRVLALILIVPPLVLLGDVVGILGGLFVALYSMHLDMEVYFNGVLSAVDAGDVIVGQIKSIVFATTIALIACQRGLATRGGATGVGSSTTSAVVTVLFAIVVLDAIFTGLFHVVGL